MRKLLVFVFVSLFALIGVIGCQEGGSNAAATQEKSHLQQILERGKIVVGITLTFPPFGMQNAQGEPEGYEVDLAKALADSLGVELEIVDVVGEARIPSLETDKIDVMLGNFTRTLTRAQKIDFTDTYIVAAQRMIVQKGSSIKTVQDLAGKKVVVLRGSTNAEVMKSLGIDAEITYLATGAEGVLAVKNGQNDAFVEDSNFLAYQAKMNPELEVVGDALSLKEYQGFGIKKGDQQWLNYLNLFLFDVNYISGVNDELYMKWFGTNHPFPRNPEY
ncbi:MAG: transporter substrate-binding domain-containing protein [Deferribacteraceae bacterium]|jgi:polar amino acid transport system substrate-binding protein|nr:transporter substrate-binding domain-containing protein [Deferribacteraceae bacterium]